MDPTVTLRRLTQQILSEARGDLTETTAGGLVTWYEQEAAKNEATVPDWYTVAFRRELVASVEKLLPSERVIRQFIAEFWRDRHWQLTQSFAGVETNPRHPDERLLNYSILAQELRDLVRAAYGEMRDSEENRGETYELCQKLAEWLFSIPGWNAYEIPDYFAETPIGAIWWLALNWAQGQELVTLAEASKLSGVPVSTLSSRVERGALQAFIDPRAPSRQGRTLVRKSDVVKK